MRALHDASTFRLSLFVPRDDLQLQRTITPMAEGEDKESKTEEATEKRMRDAIEQGNVPFSRELPTFLSLASVVLAGGFMFAGSIIELRNSLGRFIDNPGDWPLENPADALLILRTVALDTGKLLLPVVLLLMVAGIAGAVLQNPPRLVGDRIAPQLSRISPLSGWGRIFGISGFVEFLKALFKLIAVAIVGYLVLKATQSEVLSAMFMDPVTLPALSRNILVRLTAWVAGLTLVLVILDLIWSRLHWRKELRMSREELKEELKHSEGNPQVKARMRAIGRARSRKRMMAAVPKATLVITNPTHYAVALRYVRSEGGAPKVLAKGVDLIALKIREIAEQHDIPIVEDKPLARSLHDSVEVDQLIPPQFYKAVAEIIHFLHVRKSRKSQYR
jgi:flagellar biosynthesis protein FlhB